MHLERKRELESMTDSEIKKIHGVYYQFHKYSRNLSPKERRDLIIDILEYEFRGKYKLTPGGFVKKGVPSIFDV